MVLYDVGQMSALLSMSNLLERWSALNAHSDVRYQYQQIVTDMKSELFSYNLYQKITTAYSKEYSHQMH